MKNTFHVTGMGCDACAVRIKNAALGLDGVESCEIDLASEKMDVKYDENKVGFEDMKKAVEGAGYGLEEK